LCWEVAAILRFSRVVTPTETASVLSPVVAAHEFHATRKTPVNHQEKARVARSPSSVCRPTDTTSSHASQRMTGHQAETTNTLKRL
jgi:hypothetical protein